MFREVKRFKQALDKNECIEILINSKRGVLSVIDDDYPYGMPINHYYNIDDGYLYFHSGKIGHRKDCLDKNKNVSYCVTGDGYKNDDWYLIYKSVIVFGKVEYIDDINMIEDIARKMSHKFTNNEDIIDDEVNRSLKATFMFRVKIEHITGKVVEEK